MDSQDRIREIQARCDAATSGPWQTAPDGDQGNFRVEQYPGGYGMAITGWGRVTQPMNNADFIAGSRDDIPWLLSELAKANERLGFYEALEHMNGSTAEEAVKRYGDTVEQLAAMRGIIEYMLPVLEAEAGFHVTTGFFVTRDNLCGLCEKARALMGCGMEPGGEATP